jgi:hypothetical protein
MQTRELMAGQAFHFYASSGTGVVLLEGSMHVTLRNVQMDGYGWSEEMTLIGSAEWVAPRSGWIRIDARDRVTLYIAEAQPLQWRAGMVKTLKRLLAKPVSA